MKRIMILITVFCCAFGISASAANGDVVGHIYSTDIRAYINGVEVPSYNIGGKTVVVVEEATTDSNYYDDHRTLLLGSLSPEYIKGGQSTQSGAVGQLVGDILETDIKTYKYDKELTSYNLGGKTAVVIEELGGDNEFSDIGGKYVWDGANRTISLEFMYFNLDWDTMYDNQANIKLVMNADKTQATAEFYSEKYSVGGNVEYEPSEDFYDEANKPNMIIPVMTDIDGSEKLLGYYFSHKSKEFDITGFDLADGTIGNSGEILEGGKTYYAEVEGYKGGCYFYRGVLKAGAEKVSPAELTPREEVIKTHILNKNCSITEQFDTDDYTFVSMTQGTPHGANSPLMLIQADGSYHDYINDFESVSLHGTIWFDNIKIDRENEKAYFRYDKDYVIDLKTGEMKSL